MSDRVDVPVYGKGVLACLAGATTLLMVAAEGSLERWERVGLPDPMLARQVLYAYQVPTTVAVKPGAFRTALIDAAATADAENRLRLQLGFPELIATVSVVELLSDGVDRLVALLERKA